MSGFNATGWQNASDAIAQSQTPDNSRWLDRVLGRVEDGFNVYDRVRCAVNPQAPGCYVPPAGSSGAVPNSQNTTLMIVGGAILLLLIIAVLVIALKK